MMPFAVRTRPRLDTCGVRLAAPPSPTLEEQAAGGGSATRGLQSVRRVGLSEVRSPQPNASAKPFPMRHRSTNHMAHRGRLSAFIAVGRLSITDTAPEGGIPADNTLSAAACGVNGRQIYGVYRRLLYTRGAAVGHNQYL